MAGPAHCPVAQRQLHFPREGLPKACYHRPGPPHQSQQELAETAKWPPASSWAPEKGGGEGGAASAQGVIVMVTR